MKESNEKQESKMQAEDTPIMKLQKQKQELIEIIARYQTGEILQNQRTFNEWMMSEMLKLKDAVNQIGEGLSLILSKTEEATEEEPEAEEAEEAEEIEVPEPTPEPEVKKKMGRPPKASALKRILNAARAAKGYGDKVSKGMKEADPDTALD